MTAPDKRRISMNVPARNIDVIAEVIMFEHRFNGMIDTLRAMGDDVDQREVSLAQTHGEDAFARAVRALAKQPRIST